MRHHEKCENLILNKFYGDARGVKRLKVQSCKLYNNKYMIANTEIFASIAVLVFKLIEP